MKKIILLLCVLWISSVSLAQDITWTSDVIGEGIKPAIAIDSNDGIHIAYIVEDIMGAVYYATPDDSDWQLTRVSEGYFYGPLDIAVSPDDVPYIAYHDHQGENFDPNKGDEVIAVLESDEWQLSPVKDAGHDGWDNSIVLDSEGFWHTATVDPEQFDSPNGIEYASNRYASDGEFVVEAIGSGPVPYEFATSIDTYDDIVGISYFEANERDLIYAERSSGSDGTWTLTTVDSEGDVGRYSSLAFDSQGLPHISYFMSNPDDTGTVRHAWRDADGNWQIEDVDDLAKVPKGFVGSRKITSIAIDDNDTVHLVYGDRLQVMYAVRGDDGWAYNLVAESETETGNFGTLVEMALDSDGNPHIVYYVATSFSPLAGEIVYTTVDS